MALVPKTGVLSADATFYILISSDSTISLISISAKSRCYIPLFKCGISEAHNHAWLPSSLVASYGNPIRINIPLIARASSSGLDQWHTKIWPWVRLPRFRERVGHSTYGVVTVQILHQHPTLTLDPTSDERENT